MEKPSSPKSPLVRALQRVLPIVVSGAILYYYLRALDWQSLRVVAENANLPLAVAAILIPQLIVWILGALLIQRSIVWFHGPFPLLPFIWIRGSAYILMFINTALGGGGLVLYQQRRGNISWTKLIGIILFRLGLGLWGICLLMIPVTLSLHLLGLEDRIKLDLGIWWGVLIGGVVRGTLVIDDEEGELDFETAPNDPDELPITFPVLNEPIAIQKNGTVYFTGTIPAP